MEDPFNSNKKDKEIDLQTDFVNDNEDFLKFTQIKNDLGTDNNLDKDNNLLNYNNKINLDDILNGN